MKGETARLLPVAERTRYLFGKDTARRGEPSQGEADQQRKLFEELEAVEAAVSGAGGRPASPLASTWSDRPGPDSSDDDPLRG